MANIEINNITGNGNAIGDGNHVQNILNEKIPNEVLIRDDANDYAINVEYCYYLADGHKKFIDGIRNELLNYYSVEDKAVFLDQIKLKVNEYIKEDSDEGTGEGNIILSKMLYFIEQEINELPKIVRGNTKASAIRNKVFISYSQRDRLFLDDLKRHFKPLENLVEFWDDSKIKPGQKWKEEIAKALNEAKVAILLVSADFFNSDFITTNELPQLLDRADIDGMTIISVILKPCMFEEYGNINQYQAINDPKRPISSFNENDREELWVNLVRQVKAIIDNK